MASCVSSVEQNDLVVRTGLDLRLRRLDLEMLRGKSVFVVNYINNHRVNACHMINTTLKFLQPNVRLYSSILDIPKEVRSKHVIICFDEPSYNGRQCLYHLFGERLGLKPYHAFVDAMEQTQQNGDAIVFTEEEVMWYPGPERQTKKSLTTPLAELEAVEAIPRGEFGQFTVDLLPPTLKGYVERHFPQTKFVDIGKVKGTYLMWGWNKAPDTHEGWDWASQVRVEETADMKWNLLQAQVKTLAATVKALQETLSGLQPPPPRK